ncbi:hypothetical protein [Streptomyces zagrosensis]|uniref:Uncharacterized protein n=1 Tax=Streptomyces zagrosensis TaxID=1042984 RepID=A0A7W9QDI9_9ACTN|nr:hypothetical protein [Streptomyces zagrosensis]MBB5938291.1 hypothetical protein [Streptomyces zagrosensis]
MVPTGTKSESTPRSASPAVPPALTARDTPAAHGDAPCGTPAHLAGPGRPGRRHGSTRRGRLRRAGDSAYGLLLLGRNLVMALFVLVIVVAGVWTSWGTAQHATFTKGKERGTLTVASCHRDWCAGPFAARDTSGTDHHSVRIDATVIDGKGQHLPVVLKPGTHEAVRTGAPGLLYAWAPLGGALLLASVLLAGGLRMCRAAWATGLAGLGLLGAAFALL